MLLIFILAAVAIIRWAAKKFRRAGIVGTMREIEETEAAAEAVRSFKKLHPDPDPDRAEVEKFKSGK
jgi:hypothetical protein